MYLFSDTVVCAFFEAADFNIDMIPKTPLICNQFVMVAALSAQGRGWA